MGQVLHGSATTTHAIRATMQRSTAPLKDLSGLGCPVCRDRRTNPWQHAEEGSTGRPELPTPATEPDGPRKGHYRQTDCRGKRAPLPSCLAGTFDAARAPQAVERRRSLGYEGICRRSWRIRSNGSALARGIFWYRPSRKRGYSISRVRSRPWRTRSPALCLGGSGGRCRDALLALDRKYFRVHG
jgi:hypothetical protein